MLLYLNAVHDDDDTPTSSEEGVPKKKATPSRKNRDSIDICCVVFLRRIINCAFLDYPVLGGFRSLQEILLSFVNKPLSVHQVSVKKGGKKHPAWADH